MRPLTDHTPKPLLCVGGKPLIVRHIEKLVAAGITELVINHAHLGEKIEQALADGSRFGASIQYSPETAALETAGGIAHALPLLAPGGNEAFAVVNGDIYCDYDYSHLAKYAAELCDDLAHLVLVNNPEHHPKGDFLLNGTRIEDHANSRLPMPPLLTFSGVGLYRPAMFGHISRGSVAPLAPLLRKAIAKGLVSGEHHTGLWVDVGTPERLRELDAQLGILHV